MKKEVKDVFWELYLKSNSPSKCLYSTMDEKHHHSLLKLWIEFMDDEEKVRQMFWSNDNLNVAPTHMFSKMYQDRYDGSDVFLNRCVGYLCSFLFRSRNIVNGNHKTTVGTRVASSNFTIANGQVYV